jgi:hypothetical protein
MRGGNTAPQVEIRSWQSTPRLTSGDCDLFPTSVLNSFRNTHIMSQESPATRPFRIGTRRSKLAIVQAEGIRDALQKLAPHRTFEIEALRTLGDKDKSTALYSFGAKNLWTTELEEKLTSREIDVVVHCLKGEYSTLPRSFVLFVPSAPTRTDR